jgi:hypothetical protein
MSCVLLTFEEASQHLNNKAKQPSLRLSLYSF